MGSTGRGTYAKKRSKRLDDDTFGIAGATAFKGKVPEGKGLDPVGPNKITLKVPAKNNDNVLFQFKLSKNNKLMTIIGYKNGVPEVKCKVQVDSGHPSLDRVIALGTKSEKIQATKMKELFAQSVDVKENQLGAIANKLIQKKKVREGE
jgi:hypothetical protein